MNEERPREAPGGKPPPTPFWVKVFGGVTFAVVLLFVILLVVGSGHGPGRHGAGAVPSHVDR